jgi:3-deoxy-D-manno-octulosonic-acid transferase
VLYSLYNLLLNIGLFVSLPFLPFMLLLGERYRGGLSQRLGIYSDGDIDSVAGSRPIWIHAASVGEVRSAIHFIQELKRLFPTCQFVLSTFTATGNRLAREIGATDVVLFLPLDVRWIVRRALAKIEPSLLILIETEIWPNLLRETYKTGVPTLLLSGRLSDRALRRYALFSAFFRQVTRCFTAVGMQSTEDAARITQLGVEPSKVSVTGNLKHISVNGVGGVDIKTRHPNPLLIVGSSHRGEEEILLKVFVALKRRFPSLQMVLAPRHPQRFAEVENLLKTSRLSFEKRSEVKGPAQFNADVMLLDTIGELQDFYAICDIAFVGGSLVDAGGHNILEPARFRKPVLFGPYMTNFSSLATEMKQNAAGIEVRGEDDLIRAIIDLLEHPQRRRILGERAYTFAADGREVLERSIGLVARYLQRRPMEAPGAEMRCSRIL